MFFEHQEEEPEDTSDEEAEERLDEDLLFSYLHEHVMLHDSMSPLKAYQIYHLSDGLAR